MRSSTTSRSALALALVAAMSPACTGLIGDVPDDEPPAPEASSLPAQPIHKLNRLEYNNTVRDLLGTKLRPADAFPPDGESEGFDNIAAVLQLTPTLLDAYYSAARQTIDDALDQRPAYTFGFGPTDIAPFGGYPVGELWALTGNAFALSVDVRKTGRPRSPSSSAARRSARRLRPSCSSRSTASASSSSRYRERRRRCRRRRSTSRSRRASTPCASRRRTSSTTPSRTRATTSSSHPSRCGAMP